MRFGGDWTPQSFSHNMTGFLGTLVGRSVAPKHVTRKPLKGPNTSSVRSYLEDFGRLGLITPQNCQSQVFWSLKKSDFILTNPHLCSKRPGAQALKSRKTWTLQRSACDIDWKFGGFESFPSPGELKGIDETFCWIHHNMLSLTVWLIFYAQYNIQLGIKNLGIYCTYIYY